MVFSWNVPLCNPHDFFLQRVEQARCSTQTAKIIWNYDNSWSCCPDVDRWIGGSKFRIQYPQEQGGTALVNMLGTNSVHLLIYLHWNPYLLNPPPLTFFFPWPLRSCWYEQPALLRNRPVSSIKHSLPHRRFGDFHLIPALAHLSTYQ